MSLSLQSEEFKFNRPQFIQKAKEWTQKYATGYKISAAASVKVVNDSCSLATCVITEFVYIWNAIKHCHYLLNEMIKITMLHTETLWLNNSYVTDYVYSKRGIY